MNKILIFDYYNSEYMKIFNDFINSKENIKEYLSKDTSIHYSCGNSNIRGFEKQLLKNYEVNDLFKKAIENIDIVYIFGSFSYSLYCHVEEMKQEDEGYLKLIEMEYKNNHKNKYIFVNYSPGYFWHFKQAIEKDPNNQKSIDSYASLTEKFYSVFDRSIKFLELFYDK